MANDDRFPIFGGWLPRIGKRRIALNRDGSFVDTGETLIDNEHGYYYVEPWVIEWHAASSAFHHPCASDRGTEVGATRIDVGPLRFQARQDYDESGSMNRKGTTFSEAEVPEIPDIMVRATGIEPVTPTMSKKRSA